MEILEKIKTKIAKIEKQKQELIDELKTEFAPMFKPLFDKSDGKITSVSWRQYTPYFNDGDSCEFYVYADEPDVNEEDYYELEDDVQLLADEFVKVLYMIDSEFLKLLFGDHVKVTLHSDGRIETEEYDHD